MTRDSVRETSSDIVWGLLVALVLAVVFAPFVAWGQTPDVPPEAYVLDLAGLALWATGLALATEWIRSLVPAWRRGGEPMGELAKTFLRVVPVSLGIGAALAGWAPAVGDGSNPEMFGGVGAGLIASLFGGSLVGAVRDRLPSGRRRRTEEQTPGPRAEADQ